MEEYEKVKKFLQVEISMYRRYKKTFLLSTTIGVVILLFELLSENGVMILLLELLSKNGDIFFNNSIISYSLILISSLIPYSLILILFLISLFNYLKLRNFKFISEVGDKKYESLLEESGFIEGVIEEIDKINRIDSLRSELIRETKKDSVWFYINIILGFTILINELFFMGIFSNSFLNYIFVILCFLSSYELQKHIKEYKSLIDDEESLKKYSYDDKK